MEFGSSRPDGAYAMQNSFAPARPREDKLSNATREVA